MSVKSEPTGQLRLTGRRIVVAVCGGIAAYKTCCLVSRLVQEGAEVVAAMTEAGTRFVGPATLGALTGRPVITSLWTDRATHDPQHVSLTENLDALIVAPATYNMIGKIAGGIADDAVSTLVSAANCPVWLAPAMNARMWANPILQANLRRLIDLGYRTVPPGEGWLACRTVGAGRMAEPEEIFAAVTEAIGPRPPQPEHGSA